REEERQARQEELVRQKEEKLKEQAELKARREKERKVKEEELARQKEEKLKQQEELKVKQQAQLIAKQEELSRQREERLRQQEALKAKREEERQARQEELVRQKEEKLKEQAELKARQETERKTKESELARQREEKLKQQAELKAKQEEERKAREEERLRRIADAKEREEAKLKKRREKIAGERRELEAKMNEMKRSSAQKRVLTQAALEKYRKDKEKIRKIEVLWRRARKLYSKGRYEEAIRDFEKVIELEGNPRIKYTPFAKGLIFKAKEKLSAGERVTYTKQMEHFEKEMINEVIKRQIPPYVEPPRRVEIREPVTLIEPSTIRKKLKETKITMDFDKVGLKSVLLFLSQESGINFVTSAKVLEIAPVVSIRFKEASLEEVVKYAIKSLGLVYRIDKEFVWVAHPEEVANEPMEIRVYYLNKGGGLFTEFSPVSNSTTETGLGGSSAQINEIYTIEDTLREVIPWPADANLTYDKRLNALIVRNTPQNLQMLEDILCSLDVEPCQVLIEARFLEVDITDVNELGLEWKFSGEDFATMTDDDNRMHSGFAQNSGVDFSDFSNVAQGLNLTYKGVLTSPQYQAVLHALSKVTKVKSLSSPRITTLNNQMATIKVVDEWIYPTRYEYEVVQTDINGDGDFSDAGETTYKNVPKDFLRRDVGILLKVIPAVGADRETIGLSLIPEVSEGATGSAGFTYTGGVELPKFTSRNLSTTVVVKSGDTVVLGGLIKETRTKIATKVPVLGDIPFLGAFFKKNTDSIERRNLLIFVTAKVLSSSGEEVVIVQK
ncbi:MAG: hypothetical protein KKH29_03670, partial [Candidatus Omnitrophica bacterium]|nr:hypothetical protein [Candidatus Omnitrophota bacterium]